MTLVIQVIAYHVNSALQLKSHRLLVGLQLYGDNTRTQTTLLVMTEI